MQALVDNKLWILEKKQRFFLNMEIQDHPLFNPMDSTTCISRTSPFLIVGVLSVFSVLFNFNRLS